MRSSLLVAFCSTALRFPAQTPCVNGSAGPYPCSRIDLLALMTPAQLGSNTSVADLWGWTDPLTEKEYAIVGARTGTSFVDLSVPTAPVLVGFLPTHVGTGSLWRDVDVAGDRCFVGSEISGHGLQVFDLTRLRNVGTPPVTFTEDAWYGGFGNSHTIFADKQHPFVYAVGTNTASGGLHVVNVTNPLSPVIAGTYAIDGYIHENSVITYNGPDAVHLGRQISFNFHTGTPDRVTIVDVTDKSDMERLGTATYTGGYLCHQGWVTEDHRFLLMNDEGDEANLGHGTRTRVFNIEDLDAPFLIGAFTGPHASSDHNLYVHKGLAWASNYTSGLQVLDLAGVSTAQLALTAWFDTYPANNSNAYSGAWGNYPFFNSGLVLVSGLNEGLFVLRPRPVVAARVLLDGPYDPGSGLMHDSLRAQGLLPLEEPYSDLGYAHAGGGGGESCAAPVFAVQGPDAIVDWVLLELRDPSAPALVRASRSALLQRDGDIVEVDGSSPVSFTVPVGHYHIAVRHRNHLGVMSAQPLEVSLALRQHDLAEPTTALYGSEAAKVVAGQQVLWAGDATLNGGVTYVGAGNDRDPLLVKVGGITPNAIVAGYHVEDIDLDGRVMYLGAGNDRDRILVNVGSATPNASRTEQVP